MNMNHGTYELLWALMLFAMSVMMIMGVANSLFR
jgi:hypothetical protein